MPIDQELFSTVVGSHMWGMERPESDLDVFVCSIVPTKDYLAGNFNRPSIVTKTTEPKIDMVDHEIGKLIGQLFAGNINFIWGVTSPHALTTTKWHDQLKQIYAKNPAKNCFHSINGLANHNLSDYLKEYGAEDKIPSKQINMICRSLKFGVHLLETGQPQYEASEGTVAEVKTLLEDLKRAFENSSLPEEPIREEYSHFLTTVRIHEMVGLL